MSVRNKRLDQVSLRSRVSQEIRLFFWGLDYLETDSPIRLKTPALEDYIDAIESESFFLRTSPEFHMKRLLADGLDKIFQIGPCFRKNEFGERHRSEFTMLEWYRKNANYLDILDECQSLCRHISSKLTLREKYFAQDWQILSVDEVFRQFTGKPVQYFIDQGKFEETLCFEIEPHLGIKAPTVLIDYPNSMAALAKLKDDGSRLAERWELYIDGLEIANTYSELTDPVEQRQRFLETTALREKEGRICYELDEPFLQALEKGLPATAGIALGVERLIMALGQSKDISSAINFSEES